MIEQTRQLLLEAAPLVEGARSLYRLDYHAWLLIFDDETILEIRVDEGLRKLVLCMQVGSPTKDLRDPTCHVLMVFNGQFRETNGMRFALNGPDGELQLLLDLGIKDLSVDRLVSLTREFRERGQTWKELIVSRGGLKEGAVEEPGSAVHSIGIRI